MVHSLNTRDMKSIITLSCLLLMLSIFGQAVKSQHTGTTDTADIVYQVVEEMASFPGGEDSLYKHLATHLKYPQEAIDQKIEGIVYVQFVVEKDGAITNIEIRHSITPLLNQAAMDAVNTFPKWIPGKQRGKPVRTIFILPVQFRLK